MLFTRYLSFLILFSLFISCDSVKNNDVLVINSGKTQGTFYHIKYLSDQGENYQEEVDSLLFLVDNSLSTYNKSSLITRINSGEEVVTDSLFRTVFRSAKEVFTSSNGLFDCSIAPLVNAWGFGFSEKQKMDTNRVSNLLKIVGFEKIYLQNDSIIKPKRMLIDFNSIAQGYTVDLIAYLFDQKGIANYLIEVGGEIRSKGINADGNLWRIGVDKPTESIDSKDRFQFILELNNKSLATSGNYRKFYMENGINYSHVINPKTGFPAKNKLLSVTVVHNDCITADAYATAFMVMGLQISKKFLSQRKDLEVYFIYRNQKGELVNYVTENFKERIVN
jgi:thiamine biosynthesis lipoprotein